MQPMLVIQLLERSEPATTELVIHLLENDQDLGQEAFLFEGWQAG